MPESATTSRAAGVSGAGVAGGAGPAGTPGRSRAAEQRGRQLAAQIDALQLLPMSMTVPMHVLRLQRTGSAGLDAFASAVSKDAGLAAKILALVNSAAFAPTKPVTRVSQAVTMIGLKNLLPLVFSLSLSGIFNRAAMSAEDRSAWFKSSLLRAMAAQQIVTLLGSHEHGEEAFLCGLLLDVGVPLLCGCDPAVWGETAAALDAADPAAGRERELSLYGMCHAEVGRRALERLRLPKLFADAVGMHHAGYEPLAAAMQPDLARAIDVVSAIPHRLSRSHHALQALSQRLRTVPDTGPPAGADRAMGAVAQDFASVLRVLGDEDEAGAPFKQFLQETSAVVAASVCGAVEEAQGTISQLRARETGLTQQLEGLRRQVIASDIDSLTGVFTRGAFMKRIPALLAGLRQYGATCAVGYVDVDNFKSLNDAHGHAAGDAALRRVAQRLTEVVQPRGLVGRVGGDEFVFVVVSRRPLTPEEVQQRFGGPMTSLSLDLDDRTISFSTSIGVFDAGIPAETETADRLFARADRLMYGSKKSGKGRCLFARLSEAQAGGGEVA